MEKWDLKNCENEPMAIETIKKYNNDRMKRIELFRVLNYQDILNHYEKKFWLTVYTKANNHCPEATILEIEGNIDNAGRLGAA